MDETDKEMLEGLKDRLYYEGSEPIYDILIEVLNYLIKKEGLQCAR